MGLEDFQIMPLASQIRNLRLQVPEGVKKKIPDSLIQSSIQTACRIWHWFNQRMTSWKNVLIRHVHPPSLRARKVIKIAEERLQKMSTMLCHSVIQNHYIRSPSACGKHQPLLSEGMKRGCRLPNEVSFYRDLHYNTRRKSVRTFQGVCVKDNVCFIPARQDS